MYTEVIGAVSSGIDTVYNRRHSALGPISPTAFNHQFTTPAAKAA